jgi:predicted nucleic acid-binding protein
MINPSYLLDTDIVIDYLRGYQYAEELLYRFSVEGSLAVSVITHLEIYQGMRPGEEEKTTAFLDGLASIPVDVSLARKAGELLHSPEVKGLAIGIADAIIAAAALSLSIPLLTNNVTHYPFLGLRVVKGRV